jgi:putative acetyltransferase
MPHVQLGAFYPSSPSAMAFKATFSCLASSVQQAASASCHHVSPTLPSSGLPNGSRSRPTLGRTTTTMRIRAFQMGDEPALFRVYHSAIHMIACKDYTAEQVQAWAPPELDQDLWCERMRGISPFVAQDGDEIVGYADLQPSGYIDHFFVSGRHPRRGIGALLMHRIHNEATALRLSELTSDVSRTAEPFFVHYGFSVTERREPVLRGVIIPNAFMRKQLQLSASAA